MHYIPTTEPVIVAESYEQLLDGARRVCNEEALAVVMHHAFEVETLPEVSFATRRLASTGGLHYKRTSERRSTELRSRTQLPILNTSTEKHGEKHSVLPASVAYMARDLHSISTGNVIEGPFDFSLDEFRSPVGKGVMHTDGSHINMDISMHATAVGCGILHVAGIKKSAAQTLHLGTKFFEPDHMHEDIMDTPFYPVALQPGTVVVFSAFGSDTHQRAPVLHKVTTTSAFRASASIDQVEPYTGGVPKKLKKDAKKAGVHLQDYGIAA